MLKNVELRKLPAGSLCNISGILEINNDWKKVMSLIPRDPRSEVFEPKYNNEHIKLIEEHARCSNRLCADVLFEEWGTSGRLRPTLDTLKNVLKRAQIFRAADEVANMLQEDPPTRPMYGPGASIDTNITLMLQQQSNDPILNGSTAQMRSQSNDNAPKSLGNKTTLQMKSDSNLIQFSTSESLNVPDLSALGIQSSSSLKQDQQYQISLPNVELNEPCLDTDILTDETLAHFEYRQLQIMTKNFANKVSYTPDSTGGGKLAGKIGSGGFGEVFVGYHPKYGHFAIKRALNIKKLENNPDFVKDSFNKEVRFLSQFRHKNIVSIIGIAVDGPSLCLVCEYIGGGSLEKKIDEKILTEKQRMDIMIGTAEGLRYLHESKTTGDSSELSLEADKSDSSTKKKNNFVHGDVKSANILLTNDFVPKLCDFGISKQYDSTVVDIGVMGTAAYMSPEALNGTITQKLDVYSYGIVLLELLTGFKAIVQKNERERIHIKDYIEETCPKDISVVLDPFVSKWNIADAIYSLAGKCLVKDRQKRPSSEQICDILYRINNGENVNESLPKQS